jgi:hypothetical protein
MNFVALLLALAAVLCFVAVALKAKPPWLIPLGLALISGAYIVQTIWPTAHTIS